jgi:3-hydroxyisobutyrate dehydrogenase-like beta-hydroxyacid dehydrogenase
MMMKERVGFIGLGLMGSAMAAHLVQKGWPLTVVAHRRREAVEALTKLGAKEAATPRALAAESDVVILCVTGSPEVDSVINGPDGLGASEKPLLVIDCSTSNPALTIALAEALAKKGVTLIDAPLARTPKEAVEGTLDVMAGGAPEVVARATPILEAFARRVVHIGPTGSAHTMKLLNNFISMGYASIYAEALMLGAKAGLTPRAMDGVLRGGRMDCGFYNMFFEYALNKDDGLLKFAIKNALKDMTYLASFAQASGAANPIGAAVRNGFATAVATGHGDRYVPVLSEVVAGLNNVSLGGSSEPRAKS